MDTLDITSILAKPSNPTQKSENLQVYLEQQYALSPKESAGVANILQKPRVDILSDLPVSEDSLGFRSLVHTVSNVIFSENTQTPLTIAIDGEWGMGKTSFLKMIETQAKALGVPSIWLNAWHIENEKDIISRVSQELRREFNLHEANNQSSRNYLSEWENSLLGSSLSEVVKNLLTHETEQLKSLQDKKQKFIRLAANYSSQFKLITKYPSLIKLLTEDTSLIKLLTEDTSLIKLLTEDTSLIRLLTRDPRFVRLLTRNPELIAELTRDPEFIMKVTRDPESIELFTRDPELITELTRNPESIELLTRNPESIELLTRDPELIELLTRDPELITELTRDPEFLGWIKQNPHNFDSYIEKELDPLLSSYRDSSRMIIFVDDIDRAFPDQIATTLKSLKLILESRHCIIVLAMDIDIVAQALATHYQKHDNGLSFISISDIKTKGDISITNQTTTSKQEAKMFGYSFLEKLIQIQIEIPKLTRSIITRYLEEVGIAIEIIEIIRWVPEQQILNPRRLKRYLNWLSITLQLIISIPLPIDITNLNALRLIALKYDYPNIYNTLKQETAFIENYSNYLGILKLSEADKIDFTDYLKRCNEANLINAFDKFLQETPILKVKRPTESR